MNRRQFTASLAALTAAPALPFAAAAPAANVAIPPGTYAWAQLIARAQNNCSPAMLMRHLNLSSDVATALFNDMLRDGVLRPSGMAGVARAAAPLQTTGAKAGIRARLTAKARQVVAASTQGDTQSPLAKDNTTGLGCADTTAEDHTDASTDQPSQESPV